MLSFYLTPAGARKQPVSTAPQQDSAPLRSPEVGARNTWGKGSAHGGPALTVGYSRCVRVGVCMLALEAILRADRAEVMSR